MTIRSSRSLQSAMTRDRHSHTQRGPLRVALLPFIAACVCGLMAGLPTGLPSAVAQSPTATRSGDVVPRDVREIYDKGLGWLAANQSETGDWNGAGGHGGPGGAALAVMSFLASGEDPNFGVHANTIRRGLRYIVGVQDATTGYFGGSMYDHGFAMLVVAEAYGVVDERQLWASGTAPAATDAGASSGLVRSPGAGQVKSLGQSLELAVRAAITSQKKNSAGGWRYSPDSTDADTSVSGAVLVGLLAARNAGIEVPDEVIDKALKYFVQMTSESGQVGYSGGFGGFDESIARISIATLVYSVGRRKDLNQFQATLGYLTQRIEQSSVSGSWMEYANYYQAQALFQGDVVAWEKWNKLLVRRLKLMQAADGSIRGDQGQVVGTSMSLLALALNYKFLPIYER